MCVRERESYRGRGSKEYNLERENDGEHGRENKRNKEREIVDSEMISYLSVGWWPCIGVCTRIFPFGRLSISISAYIYVFGSVFVCSHANVCVCVCVCV